MRHVILASTLLLAASTACILAPSCAGRAGSASTDDNRATVDTALMAFLSEARALHHTANVHDESGNSAGAIAAMERLVAAKPPASARPSPEVEEVLADAYARLAELRLRSRDLDAAAKAVASGLTHAEETSYFKGHLIEVEGLIEEARTAEFADAGKPAEAARARDRALRLLEEVVKIQEQVIQRSLVEGGSRP